MSSEHYAGFTFEDYGDPAGQSSSSITQDKPEKTCFDMLRGRGIGIQAGEQNPTIRIESVRKPLNTLRSGKPQFQIGPRCEVLRKGFRGRYQYKRIKITGSGERYHDVPDKNEFSHPHDALQYVATKVFGDAVRGREEQRKRWAKPIEEIYRQMAKRRAAIV